MLKAAIDPGGIPISDVSDVPALKITLAVDEVLDYPNSGKVGKGWAKYPNITLPENSNADFDFAADGTLDYGAASAGFGSAVDAAAKVNIYTVGTDIKIQNKTAAEVVVTYSILAV